MPAGRALTMRLIVFAYSPRNVGIVAARAQHAELLRIAQARGDHLVELDVGAAGFAERAQLGDVGFAQVVPESVQIGIGLLADGRARAEVIDGLRRRHRHLRRFPGQRLDEAERAGVDALRPADPAGHLDARQRHVMAGLVAKHGRRAAVVAAHVLERQQELAPPDAAAEFAVGDRAHAGALLQLDRFAHAFVLDCAQFLVAVRAEVVVEIVRAEDALARLHQPLRAAQAADLVGPERGTCIAGH